MAPLLQPRHRTVGRAGCLCNFILGKTELKTALPEMCRNRADLPEGTDALIFDSSVTICLTTLSTTSGRLGSTASNGAVGILGYIGSLSRSINRVTHRASLEEHRPPRRAAVDEGLHPYAPESRSFAS
jgi:hypothetical protein